MRISIRVAAILAVVFCPALALAGPESAGGKCPSGSAGRDFDGLLLCVPQGNARYVLTKDGVDWMAWRGDDPIAFPAKGEPTTGDAFEITLARTWLGEAAVGMSDQVVGKGGFDRFMSLMAASILDGAQHSSPAAKFAVDLPVDESGVTQQFQFARLAPDLVQGEPAGQDDSGVDFILFRPSSGEQRPHILLCSGGKSLDSPTHMCMSMRDVDGHRVGIMVTGTKLARSFRITEEIVSDLESFAIRQAP